MKSTRYTVKEFNAQFPTDDACLEYIWERRFPNGAACQCGKVDSFYRVKRRKCYSCSRCGRMISPCEGTIFHNSRTKLRTWFFAMFLMTASKNGVSALELERQTGVTYKTAWRMAHQIRKLMKQGGDLLSGVVEMDETYVGGAARAEVRMRNKTPVIAAVQRGGQMRAVVSPNTTSWAIKQLTDKHVSNDTHLVTDDYRAYLPLTKRMKGHSVVQHSLGEYVRGEIHTNSVEGFWGQLKRSINGTFHFVSRQHLQAYVDEFAFRYNHRQKIYPFPVFGALVPRVAERTRIAI